MMRLRTLFTYPEIWILAIAAVVTRLWQLGSPSDIVFDEVYFRQFAANYLSGHYFFDVHPPLVKLLFAGIGSLAGFGAPEIASGVASATVLRFFPALAGAALVVLIYVIIRQLGLGRRMAFLGAFLTLCDNALLVESRFVLMDSLLLLFGFGAVSSYLKLRKSRGSMRWVWLLTAATLIGMLVTTKWTGFAIAGLIAVSWIVESVLHKVDWRRLMSEAVVAIYVVGVVYIGCFAIHFALLPRSGDGDAFMSERFRSTLVGSPYYKQGTSLSFWDKFVELNTEMYAAQNSLVNATHPYASRWYSWPLEVRSIYYWQGAASPDGKQGNIYLLGNPVVWWLSAAGAAIAMALLFVRPRLLGHRRKVVAFLTAGFALNFIPFVFIERPMFLYHYFFAFVFSLLLFCAMLATLFDWQRKKYGLGTVYQTYWILLAAAMLGFVYFLPLSYGWPLSTDDLQLHMWLPTWR